MKLIIGNIEDIKMPGAKRINCTEAILDLNNEVVYGSFNLPHLHPSAIGEMIETLMDTEDDKGMDITLVSYDAYVLDYMGDRYLEDVYYLYEGKLVKLTDIPLWPKMMSFGDLSELTTSRKIDEYIEIFKGAVFGDMDSLEAIRKAREEEESK